MTSRFGKGRIITKNCHDDKSNFVVLIMTFFKFKSKITVDIYHVR